MPTSLRDSIFQSGLENAGSSNVLVHGGWEVLLWAWEFHLTDESWRHDAGHSHGAPPQRIPQTAQFLKAKLGRGRSVLVRHFQVGWEPVN
jgi:hypothetical protein